MSDITNKVNTDKDDKTAKKGVRYPPTRERRERGPPENGIPSKNKVMVANLPYDLSEAKVMSMGHGCPRHVLHVLTTRRSSRNFLPPMNPLLLRLPCVPFLGS